MISQRFPRSLEQIPPKRAIKSGSLALNFESNSMESSCSRIFHTGIIKTTPDNCLFEFCTTHNEEIRKSTVTKKSALSKWDHAG